MYAKKIINESALFTPQRGVVLSVKYFQSKGRYEGLYGNIIAAKKKETQRSKVWLREHRARN